METVESTVFPHLYKEPFLQIFILNVMHRQDSVDLVNCVNALEMGHLCDESICILRFALTFFFNLSPQPGSYLLEI